MAWRQELQWQMQDFRGKTELGRVNVKDANEQWQRAVSVMLDIMNKRQVWCETR